MHVQRSALALISAAALLGTTSAIELDVNSSASILSAAKIIVDDILSLYHKPSTSPPIPGIFPVPTYWWESGLAFDSLINYWALSGDESVVNVIQTGVLFQTGPDYNFMPPNQTKSEGNDDQATWALAAMTAAENGFPQAATQNVSWVQLAKNVFDSQVARWDTATCDGGLRWQIFTFNTGYSYKNAISNGDFMQLAARLARFTGNQTYSDWALKTLEWSASVGLIDKSGNVFDGTDANTNCTSIDHVQWTQTAGAYLQGTAFLANVSRTKTNDGYTSLLASRSLAVFADTAENSTDSGIITEVACLPQKSCNLDQKAFIASFARSLARARDLAHASLLPVTLQSINTTLRASAEGAAASCSGGSNNTACGQDYTVGMFDGNTGLGQELSALEVILANLPGKALRTAANSTVTTSTSGSTGSTNSTNSAAPTPTPAQGAASSVTVGLSFMAVIAAMGTSMLW